MKRIGVFVAAIALSLVLLFLVLVGFSFAVSDFYPLVVVFFCLLPFSIIYLHDYFKKKSFLGRLSFKKTLPAAAVMVATSFLVGYQIPLTLLRRLKPQFYLELDLGGMIYFVLPLLFYLWFTALWLYFGFDRRAVKWLVVALPLVFVLPFLLLFAPALYPLYLLVFFAVLIIGFGLF